MLVKWAPDGNKIVCLDKRLASWDQEEIFKYVTQQHNKCKKANVVLKIV
jgi:hypothetical protein